MAGTRMESAKVRNDNISMVYNNGNNPVNTYNVDSNASNSNDTATTITYTTNNNHNTNTVNNNNNCNNKPTHNSIHINYDTYYY